LALAVQVVQQVQREQVARQALLEAKVREEAQQPLVSRRLRRVQHSWLLYGSD
jgi:hypothetical protein